MRSHRGSRTFRSLSPESETHRSQSLGLGDAAVEAVIYKKLVVVHALFVSVEHLVLGSQFGDPAIIFFQLAHSRVFFGLVHTRSGMFLHTGMAFCGPWRPRLLIHDGIERPTPVGPSLVCQLWDVANARSQGRGRKRRLRCSCFFHG